MGIGGRLRVGERVDDRRRVALVGWRQRTGRRAVAEGGRGDAVDAAAHAMGVADVVLVAEGVAEDLDRPGAGDDVAVPVQPGVDLGQGELAVAVEDLEAGHAEHDAGEGDGAGRRRWERRHVDRRGTTAAAPVGPRVELVADHGEVLEDLEPLVGHGDLRTVEVPQAGDEGFGFDVEAEALDRPKARDEAHLEGGGVAHGGWAAAHERRFPVGPRPGDDGVGIVGRAGSGHVVSERSRI